MGYNNFGDLNKNSPAPDAAGEEGDDGSGVQDEMNFRLQFDFLDKHQDMVSAFISRLSGDLLLLTGASCSFIWAERAIDFRIPAAPVGSKLAWHLLRTIEHKALELHIGDVEYLKEFTGDEEAQSSYSELTDQGPVIFLTFEGPMWSPCCYEFGPDGMERYIASKTTNASIITKSRHLHDGDRALIVENQGAGSVVFMSDKDAAKTTLTDATHGPGMILLHELLHNLRKVKKRTKGAEPEVREAFQNVKNEAHSPNVGETDTHIELLNKIRAEAEETIDGLYFGSRVDHLGRSSIEYSRSTSEKFDAAMKAEGVSKNEEDANRALVELAQIDKAKFDIQAWRIGDAYFMVGG